ncbi:hypothetical protein MNBD_CPR01-586 [hydrothermal vent metagenome]|uniref:Uncharacterized protein n=1 Tax=hydrothermal vent metagenome TaxID=652676 RepID=A0A3B0VMC3_9ZZZZ
MISTFFETIFSSPISAVFLGIFILVLFALVVLVVVIAQFGTQLQYFATPIHDKIAGDAEHNAEQILEQARAQSRVIIATAEESAKNMLNEHKKETISFQEDQKKYLEELTAQSKKILTQQMGAITQSVETVATDFKVHITEIQASLDREEERFKQVIANESERLKESFVGVGTKTETEYHALIEETKKVLSENIEKDIKRTREVLSAYRSQQIEILNKNIVSMVEETARITLGKVLTLGEHRELIMKALQEAKQEDIFSTQKP